MKFSKTIMLFAFFTASLAGCGNKSDTAAATKAAAPETKVGTNATAAQAFDTEKKLQKEKNSPDKTVPISNYTALDNSEPSGTWATYVAVSQAVQPTSDEELLNMFSGRYFNEQDAFKKRELIPVELPRIKDLLAKYKAQKYYSLSFGGEFDKGSVNPSMQLDAYNFDTKSFNINGGNCFNSSYGNRQSVLFFPESKDPAICSFKVDDIELAKVVENLRAKNNANVRGTFYFFVSSIDNDNQVKGVVTHIQYDVYDKPSYLKGGALIASYKI